MAEFIGKKLRVEIYGESHAEKVGFRAQGFPEWKIDLAEQESFVARRKASGGVFSTPRIEADEPLFYGLVDGCTTADFGADIVNANKKSADYNKLYARPRPGHADYAWYKKDGALDFSGGGRFSGRLTAPLVVLGGIAKQILRQKGVRIEAYVSAIGSVSGRSYKGGTIGIDEVVALRGGAFPSLDKKDEMIAEIAGIMRESDSVGGRIECIVSGLGAGCGNNLFEGLEGKVATLVYAVPGVKGVEFGAGFDLATMRGSTANDPLRFVDGDVRFVSNNAGGINGGISNGNDITIGVAMRPTPSIGRPQDTVDLVSGQNVQIEIKGRHDSCIVPRAVPCIESAVALAILDEIL